MEPAKPKCDSLRFGRFRFESASQAFASGTKKKVEAVAGYARKDLDKIKTKPQTSL